MNSESLNADQAREVLVDCRAILHDDHFVYISGDHGSGWIDKDVIFIDPQRIRSLTTSLAELLRGLNAEILCGPATGGLIVAQWTALALGLPAVFAEHGSPQVKQELRGVFGLHRNFDKLVAGKRVLVVDDVVNTGLSIRQTAAAVRDAGGSVIAAAALVHRGNIDAAGMGVPRFVFLVECDIPAWPADKCPLCRAGKPVNTHYAHGQDFVDSRR